MTIDRWHEALRRAPWLVLDGPLATELGRRGHRLDDALWSARLLADDPDAITRVHLDYFRAGADVATTATYQASVAGFQRRGLSHAAALDLLGSAVALADRARRAADAELRDGRIRLVLASAGSHGATLANGAEYTGDFAGIDHGALVEFHRERLRSISAGADLVLFETVPSLAEVEAIAEAVEHTTLPVAISCTLRDAHHLGSGEAIERVASAIAGVDRVVAIGVNCCAPWHVAPALARLRRVTRLPLLAYPNAGERYDGAARRFVGTPAGPASFARLAARWVAAGASAVGSCCRTGIGHTVALARLRRDHGPQHGP